MVTQAARINAQRALIKALLVDAPLGELEPVPSEFNAEEFPRDQQRRAVQQWAAVLLDSIIRDPVGEIEIAAVGGLCRREAHRELMSAANEVIGERE